MPTYEYACRQCGEHLEVVQSFKDDPLTQCPACQGALRKVYSAAGLIFKGSGWHVKDYAASSKSSSSSKGAAGDSKSESGSTGDSASAGDSGGKADSAGGSGSSTGSSKSSTSEKAAKSA